MAAKKNNNLSSDGRSQKKRPSVAGKKVAQGSRISTTASSKTGTPRLDRSSFKKSKKTQLNDSGSFAEVSTQEVLQEVSKSSSKDFNGAFGGASGSGSVSSASGAASMSGVDNADGVADASAVGSASGVEGAGSASGVSDAASASGASAAGKLKARKPLKRKGISRRFLIGSLVVILLLVIGTGLLAWNQWFRYDDAADIQGTWVIDGSSQSITINETDIVMTDDVSYPYTLDTFQKTISFSFKQYSGSGSYAFSPERTTLVITETDADTGEKVSTKLVKQ
ncbi:MAG: hypothetical protein UDM08_02620 [Eggerthellaceae bacterium]|nr:hypothetical protein [Eggerthellaceae bacterium]